MTDYPTIAAVERRLKDLEHWAVVELPNTVAHLRETVSDLEKQLRQAGAEINALHERLARLEQQENSPGCKACTEGLHDRIGGLEENHQCSLDNLARRLEELERKEQQGFVEQHDWLTRLEEGLARMEHDRYADKQPAEEPAQPRCCICADSPETAFRQPLPCPDCGRHPQPASGPSDYAIQKAAGVWCRPELGHKVMDVELATGFARVIDEINQPKDAGQWGSVEEEPAELVEAISLLMRCVPILDLHVSQHNDGRRLRSAICEYLADSGYPGWREARCPAEEALTFGSALQLGDLIRSYTFTPAEAYEINKLVTSRVR